MQVNLNPFPITQYNLVQPRCCLFSTLHGHASGIQQPHIRQHRARGAVAVRCATQHRLYGAVLSAGAGGGHG